MKQRDIRRLTEAINVIALAAMQEFGTPMAPGGTPFMEFGKRDRFAKQVIDKLHETGYELVKRHEESSVVDYDIKEQRKPSTSDSGDRTHYYEDACIPPHSDGR